MSIDFHIPSGNKTDTRINCSPEAVFGDADSKSFSNYGTEFFFPDQIGKTGQLTPEYPDPLAPEKHTLDITDPVCLDMVHQEIMKYPELFCLTGIEIQGREQFSRHFGCHACAG